MMQPRTRISATEVATPAFVEATAAQEAPDTAYFHKFYQVKAERERRGLRPKAKKKSQGVEDGPLERDDKEDSLAGSDADSDEMGENCHPGQGFAPDHLGLLPLMHHAVQTMQLMGRRTQKTSATRSWLLPWRLTIPKPAQAQLATVAIVRPGRKGTTTKITSATEPSSLGQTPRVGTKVRATPSDCSERAQ